ncbi:hypothetical protein F7725_009506 [Dissostichus mawsoni]|uniref:Alpha-1,3-mannosyl-glycoprotein 4-beta-N-acetylglucosaminyltransferase B n=1 Tax=Dissostichus mawsoni TaxID=36200 RepID=A0A7J5XNT8_DISMA|nr:hypothetical protein F7725_009506 [Dissostichus mawsoni]
MADCTSCPIKGIAISVTPTPHPLPHPPTATEYKCSAAPDLQTLYQRLLAAEERAGQVGRDLSRILEPNIYLYLPHLRLHPDSLLPNVLLGQGRRGGIVQSGLLEVVSPHQHYYPNFTLLRETLGDSKDRLEDDVVAKAGYFNNMKTFATVNDSKQWLFLEFSQLGFIGKMFRTSDLPMITEFFLMFHKDKPVDWLLDHILWVKACNPEKDAKHCTQQKALHKKRYKPSLFQHVGLHSSLPGKVQYLKDKDFEKQALYQVHSNPAAEVSSSLKHYQQHSLERAYTGKDFFWALTPIKNDYILFNFTQPINITRYLFRSGNVETSADKFYNTTVEVLPSNVSCVSTRPTGAFVDGLAAGDIEESLQPISALRLLVHSDADVWALLSEPAQLYLFFGQTDLNLCPLRVTAQQCLVGLIPLLWFSGGSCSVSSGLAEGPASGSTWVRRTSSSMVLLFDAIHSGRQV